MNCNYTNNKIDRHIKKDYAKIDMDVLYMVKREGYRRGLSHKTIITYVHCIRQFMKCCNKEPQKVSKKDIQEYLDTKLDKGVCGNTLNVHINALKFMFEEILCKRLMLRIRYSKTPKSLPIFLSKEEVIRLFNAVTNPRHKLILELIYSAGLRVGEVVQLRKCHLDFDRNIGWVRNGKGRKDRPFIVAQLLRGRLREHVDACTNNDSYLFPGRHGHLHVRSVQEIIKTAAQKAQISKEVHPHTLRHSFATHLIENGYDIATLQPLLGHSSPETTFTYVHMAHPQMISVRSPYDTLKENKPENEKQ